MPGIVEYTPNYALAKHPSGYKGWTERMNANFDIIDTQLKLLADSIRTLVIENVGNAVETVAWNVRDTPGIGDEGAWLPILRVCTPVSVYATIKIAADVEDTVIDIERSENDGESWSTILTTDITILGTERVGTSGVVIGDDLTLNTLLRIYIDSIGAGAKDLVVALMVSRTIEAA